jgi:molybdopterin molybdotransferase
MSPFDDGLDMRRAADERLLTGLPVEGETDLELLVTTLRSMGSAPAPAPTAALRAILSDGLPGVRATDEYGTPEMHPDGPDSIDDLAVRRAGRGRQRLALGARVALGAAAAAAIATGAAALEPVPAAIREPARAVIEGAVNLLTPWSSSAGEGTPAIDDPGETGAESPAGVEKPGDLGPDDLRPGDLRPGDTGQGDAVTPPPGPSVPGGPAVPPVEVGRPAEPGAPADLGPPVDAGPPPEAGPPQDLGISAPGSVDLPTPPGDAADRGTGRGPYPSPAP